MGPVDTNGFVARAGSAALVRIGTLEKRSTLRRLLAEAEEGQDLHAHARPPVEPEFEDPDADEEASDFEHDELHDFAFEDEDEGEELGGLRFEDEDEDALGDDPGPEEKYTIADPALIDALPLPIAVRRWLGASPLGAPRHPSTTSAKPVLALACGWASTAVHALADGPRTLSEIQERVLGNHDRPRLRGYLEAMAQTGLVEAAPGPDGESRYAVTEWLRQGMAPLVAAAHFEHRFARQSAAPPDRLDIGAAFMLTLPRLRLWHSHSGSCRLGVESGGRGMPKLSGVTVELDAGRVASVRAGLDVRADTWATGSSADWLDAVMRPDSSRVRGGGDTRLARDVIVELNQLLFAGRPFDPRER